MLLKVMAFMGLRLGSGHAGAAPGSESQALSRTGKLQAKEVQKAQGRKGPLCGRARISGPGI